ncbi:MAG: hypothetical protein AB1555_16835 [Nitrospirota bacterium]
MHESGARGWWTCFFSLLSLFWIGSPAAAEPPCDRYPTNKQVRCAAIWKELNEQGEAEVARFGLAQQKRREEGKITAEQHLQENIAFIKQATEKRLKLLDERMAKE